MHPNWASKEKRFKCSEGVNRWPSRLAILIPFQRGHFFHYLNTHHQTFIQPQPSISLLLSPPPTLASGLGETGGEGGGCVDGGVQGGESCACVRKIEVRLCPTQGSAKMENKMAQCRHFSVRERSTRWDPASGMSRLLLTVYGWMGEVMNDCFLDAVLALSLIVQLQLIKKSCIPS